MLDIRLADVAKALRCPMSLLSRYERGWVPWRADAKERWEALAAAYARFLDAQEAKSKAGRCAFEEGGDAHTECDRA